MFLWKIDMCAAPQCNLYLLHHISLGESHTSSINMKMRQYFDIYHILGEGSPMSSININIGVHDIFILNTSLDLRHQSPGPIESLQQLVVDWLVGWWVGSHRFFSKTALRIFLIFCMKIQHYKGKKCTGPFVRKKFSSPKLGKKGPKWPKNGVFGVLAKIQSIDVYFLL